MVDVLELREIDLQFDEHSWLTQELQETLDVLPTDKHRETVLRLTEGRIIGRPDEDTFRLEGVCAKKTWHGPFRDGMRTLGWKDDPLVAKALQLAEQCFIGHADAAIQSNLDEAQRQLAMAAVQAVMTLSALMDTCDNDETKRKAANDILDRVETFGRKSSTSAVLEQRSISFDLTQVPQDVLQALASAKKRIGGPDGEIVE